MVCTRLMNEKTPAETVIKEIIIIIIIIIVIVIIVIKFNYESVYSHLRFCGQNSDAKTSTIATAIRLIFPN